jgi:hypothetical protein
MVKAQCEQLRMERTDYRFSRRDTVNDLAGTFVTGSTQSQAVTLLHELGHAYDDMYGPASTLIVSDAGSTAQSMANTALVQKNCFH